MAENGTNDKGPELPPKLDLRKTGVLKGHIYSAPGEESPPKGDDAPAEPKPVEKPSEPKPTETPAEPKPVAPPPTQPEPSEPKPAAPRPVEPKPVKPPPSQPQAAGPKSAQARPAAPVGPKPPREEASASAEKTPAMPTLKAKPIVKSKKDTARIPLDLAKPGPTKTIKIKPATAPAAVKPPAAAAEGASKAADEKTEEGDSAKSKTSRIPLESALASDAEKKQQAQAPKTIRLKRPASAGAVKTKPDQAAPKEAEAGAASQEKGSALSKTSRLDHAAVDSGEAATATRKKTIRVKRPTQRQGAKSLAVSRPQGAEEPAAAAAPQPAAAAAPAKTGKPVGWFSVTCGIAATLVSCVIIYLFLVQAFGPNASLTELSYGAPGMDLVWPGEIPPAP